MDRSFLNDRTGRSFPYCNKYRHPKDHCRCVVNQPLEPDKLSYVYSVSHSRDIALFGYHAAFNSMRT